MLQYKILPWLRGGKKPHHSIINYSLIFTECPLDEWYLHSTVLRTDSPPPTFHNVLVTDRRVDIILYIRLFGLLELFGPPQITNGFNAEGFLVKLPTCYEVCVLTDCFSCWLVAVKSKLAVTASVHVYSIQKAMLKDSGPLFNTDYDILKSNLQNCSKWAP